MGVVLQAHCPSCGYRKDGLRLGATHAQIAAHDVTTHELFRASCCGEVLSVLVSMGAAWPPHTCETCQQPVPLDDTTRYRIATLKGEVYQGHRCPRCQAEQLEFIPGESFR